MATIAVARTNGLARHRFTLTIFVGSFLLFLVQPMVARLALPRLGGASAVWNSAMLVYQALLLGGYAYAHLLGRLSPRRQAVTHLAAFALAGLILPIGLVDMNLPANANPFLWVPWLLLVSIGPLFFVVSAQAPLIQRWFAVSDGRDPFRLYAASNLGSFCGLFSYPLIVEPLMPLQSQTLLWSAGYIGLAALVAWCALALPRHSPEAVREKSAPPSWRALTYWALVASVPSALILSTTLHLTTDIMAMPLLWVLPLGAYLLSFTFAFSDNARVANAIGWFAPILLLFSAGMVFVHPRGWAVELTVLAILTLFAVSVGLHRRLYESRPDADHLTAFYLALSVGGVVGGIFCALLAPLVFDWTYEHPILLVAAAAMLLAPTPFARIANLWDGNRTARVLTAICIPLVLVLSLGRVFDLEDIALPAIWTIAILSIGNRPLYTVSLVALLLGSGGWDRIKASTEPGRVSRSFFGVYSIADTDNSRVITHGTTLHGIQNIGSPARERMTTSYYAPKSGVGLALGAADRMFGPSGRVGVVGLGAGTLACYARPGQQWLFYEIDPLVVGIARQEGQFTFLKRCLPDARVVVGDARISLAKAAPESADVLVIDAFSSDSIPIHLLTREAFDVYRRHLSPRGLLLVHISNRYLDLRPVLAAEAQAGGWQARFRFYEPTRRERDLSYAPSQWVALSRSEETIRALPGEWTALPRTDLRAWTDDHASVLPIIK